MPKENVYIKRSSSGKLKFVRVTRQEDCYSPPPPFSPPLTPRYRPRDYYEPPHYERANVSRREMENMLDRERTLRAHNESLRQQIEVIKADCIHYENEARRAGGHVFQLQAHNRELDALVRSLKRDSQHSIDAERRLDELKMKYAQAREDKQELRAQNHSLRQKLKVLVDETYARLQSELDQAVDQARDWKARLDRNMILSNSQEERIRRLRHNNEDLARRNDELKIENRKLRDDNSYYRRVFGGGP